MAVQISKNEILRYFSQNIAVYTAFFTFIFSDSSQANLNRKQDRKENKLMKKKTFLFCAAVLLLVVAFVLPSGATSGADGYSWYCVHVKDHKRPHVDPQLSFVESLGGYYLDRKLSDDSADKVVYLTFDAGYENGNVAKILDILRAENVKGAFFILENLIRKEPDLIRRMVAEGHTVANHTAHHRDMSHADNETLLQELHTLENAYYDLIGSEMPRYYRPPEGRFSRANLECLSENGYQTVFWSFAYPDWDNNRQMSPERAKSIILENVHNGEVMLLHPTSSTNAAILGDVISALKSLGYRFGVLDELTAE